MAFNIPLLPSIPDDLTIINTLTVGGNTTLGGNLTVAGDLDVTGALDFTGDVEITGDLDVTGLLTINPAGAFGVTTGLRFGDGDTGFYESADDTLQVYVGGYERWRFVSSSLISGTDGSASLRGVAASATAPSVLPDSSDTDTGIGQYGNDALSLIAGGVEAMRLTEDSGLIAISAPGTMTITGVPTAASLAGASLSINPATAPADSWLIAAGVGGTPVFSVDEDGDVYIDGSKLSMNIEPSDAESGIHAIASLGSLIVVDSKTDASNKTARWGTTHYTNAQDPFYFIYARSSTTINQLNLGGGTSSGVAATVVNIHTAANNTTTIGTLRASWDSTGLLTQYYPMTITGVPTAATLAGASLSINPATATAGYSLQEWGIGWTHVFSVHAPANSGNPTLDPALNAGRTRIYAGNAILESGVQGTSPYLPWMQARDIGGAGATKNMILQPMGGLVGIGMTTSPGRTLDITGTFRASSNGEIGGTLDVGTSITAGEMSSDPADPAEGHHVTWQSDGTGAGDDGDILMKITAGGVTKTVTIVDFSAF